MESNNLWNKISCPLLQVPCHTHTQLYWVSPTHFLISYLGNLWSMGYPFACKNRNVSINSEKWTKTMFSELSSFFPFSLYGRRTNFSWKLTNLVNPSVYPLLNTFQCPLTSRLSENVFPTSSSLLRKNTFLPIQRNVLLVSL